MASQKDYYKLITSILSKRPESFTKALPINGIKWRQAQELFKPTIINLSKN